MMEALAEALVRAVRDGVGRENALLFSGGLDSSVTAWILQGCAPFTAYAGGLEGSHDLLWAKKASNLLGIPLVTVVFREGEVLRTAAWLYSEYGLSVVEVSFEVPLVLVLRRVRERTVFTGQGADELFGGYRKYLEDPSLMNADLERVISTTSRREMEIARQMGKELVMPYLHPEVVKIVRAISPEERIAGGVRKRILREAAERMRMPREIVAKEKKAVQYGSGVMRVLKREARRRGMSVEGLLRELA
jgi:asparagine synthase (glutamine-hydrolysing)